MRQDSTQVLGGASLVGALLVASALVFLANWFIISRNGVSIWARAHDMKYYGMMARRAAMGEGFQRDAFHVAELKEGITHLTASTHFYIHPLFAALLMKLEGNASYEPLLHTTAWYLAFAVVLLFFLLRRYCSDKWALAGALFFTLSPFITHGSRVGLTEPLMLVILSALFLAYFEVANPYLSSFLSGLCLGILNVTRPTGTILLPAFLFLIFRARGIRHTILFFLPFSAMLLTGAAIENQGELRFTRFFDFTRETIGGPDFNRFRPIPLSVLEMNVGYWQPILQKMVKHALGIAKAPFLFFSDFWVFVPAMLFLSFRRGRGWFGFLVLTIAASVASVLLFWFEPRVTLHLVFFFSLLGVVYFRLLGRNIRPNLIVMALVAFGFLFACHTFALGRLIVGGVLAVLFCQPFLKNRQRWSGICRGAVVGLLLAVSVQYIRNQIRENIFSPHETELPREQTNLAGLAFLPVESVIFSESAHDLSWYAGRTSVYFPSNLELTARFLRRFGRPLFLAHPAKKMTDDLWQRFLRAGFYRATETPEGILVFADKKGLEKGSPKL